MISVIVTEISQVAEARRRAVAVARSLGFGEAAAGRVAIVATELATNIVKYGASGEVLIATYDDETGAGIELVALDRGGGIANLSEAMRDGYSTGGSAGTGLGAVRRQAQAFDICSWPERGTVVLARLDPSPGERKSPPPMHGAVQVALRGEAVSGDAYCLRPYGRGWTVVVADGLGHGPLAAEASAQAIDLFRRHEADPPGEILGAIHAGMRHTRGGAVSVTRLDPDAMKLVYAGIGNVAGVAVTPDSVSRMVSLPGTAGHVARRIKEFEYPFPPDALMIMHSDGIGTSWSLDRYPGLAGAHPSLIAAVLYRDFARGRDDAAIVVARAPGG